MMQKIFSLFITSTLFLSCTIDDNHEKETKTETKTQTRAKFVSFPLNRVGYITELGKDSEENYFKKYIFDNQKKYDYQLDGSQEPAYDLSLTTTRAYGADSPKAFKNALGRLSDNNVGLTFVESDNYFKKLYKTKKIPADNAGDPDKYKYKPEINFWKEILKEDLYKGHLVIVGKDSKYYRTAEDKVGQRDEKWEWKSPKIATFEFSEIISAYYMGYLTQYSFGKTKSGAKKSVGYLLAASFEENAQRDKNIKKAVAFRQGVLDAQKEHKTGEATFALKSSASDFEDDKTLVMKATQIEDRIPNLAKSLNYKNKTHSFVYVAGASALYNNLIAKLLLNQSVKNANGHNIIGEDASITTGDMFDGSSDSNYIKATEQAETKHIKNKSVSGRIAMFYNKDNLAYKNDGYNLELSTKWAIERILDSIYNKDNLDLYFNRHNYVGTLPLIYQPGQQGLPSSLDEGREISDEIKNILWNKSLSEDDFDTKSEFMGWDE